MRILLLVVGTMSVIAGLIGILLPLVPTTPFLLLAAWCFARSSPRFYRLLLGNRWLGPYIRNYREGRGLTMAAKVSTLVVLWLAIASTVWFIAPMPWARVVLLTIATGVTIYLLRLPTTTAEASQTRAEAGAPAETGWD
ncbi:MAG TPA: YbaN family protein [Candidatus Latescibacteria bacterium]|nr:YbaN family protein [Candidatus Latescibacterota bacterium]MDP7635548.1 YbaN family protein [Candidatus Latescibacterota bacterium]HJN28615.1 YbaN family protein [Candidatus Latescibacterota bacterium]